MHSAEDVLPAAEIIPSGQLTQASESVLPVAPTLAYLPAAQSAMIPEQVLTDKPTVSP